MRLEFYEIKDLEQVVLRGASVLGINLTEDGAREIAARSRGTPRVAVRLLRRVRDFAGVAGVHSVCSKIADEALRRLEVDELGLDSMDRRYLSCIAANFWRTGWCRHFGGSSAATAGRDRGSNRASFTAMWIASTFTPGTHANAQCL